MAPVPIRLKIESQPLAYENLRDALQHARKFIVICARDKSIWTSRNKVIPVWCQRCGRHNTKDGSEIFPVIALIEKGWTSREPNLMIVQSRRYQVRPILDMIRAYKLRRKHYDGVDSLYNRVISHRASVVSANSLADISQELE